VSGVVVDGPAIGSPVFEATLSVCVPAYREECDRSSTAGIARSAETTLAKESDGLRSFVPLKRNSVNDGTGS
jgi:hypothetical protein